MPATTGRTGADPQQREADRDGQHDQRNFAGNGGAGGGGSGGISSYNSWAGKGSSGGWGGGISSLGGTVGLLNATVASNFAGTGWGRRKWRRLG